LAPTLFDALIAAAPATSLTAAFGMAGYGYLAGREGLAACGAVAGALGLVVERFNRHGVRLRLRRERARHRGDVQELSRLLHDVRRDLAGLRADLDDVRAERDSVRSELQAALGELAAARRARVTAPLETTPVAGLVSAGLVNADVGAGSVRAESAATAASTGDTASGVEATRAQELPLPALVVPGQVRSPIATGGIPLLAPGPREPVRADQRSVREGPGDVTQPIPVMTAERADALVYAALAEADAAARARVLARPGAIGPQSGVLHTGHAHRAGDHAREDPSACAGAPMLYVVRQGRDVA
jgi:hypothetical protein